MPGDGTEGMPDLVYVGGMTVDGRAIDGYAKASDLFAFSPDHPRNPANPDEALRWQAEREVKYPNGWDIPVYEKDGVTQIGTFHMGW